MKFRLFSVIACVCSSLSGPMFAQDENGSLAGSYCDYANDKAACEQFAKAEKETYEDAKKVILAPVYSYELFNSIGTNDIYIKNMNSGEYLNGFDAKTFGPDSRSFRVGVSPGLTTDGSIPEAYNGTVSLGYDGPIDWSKVPTMTVDGRTVVDGAAVDKLRAVLFFAPTPGYFVCKGVLPVQPADLNSRECFPVIIEPANQ